MPKAPKRTCAWPSCRTLIREGTHCAKHAPPDRREQAHRRGYDDRWRRMRRQYIIANPVCEIRKCCDGDLATQVDHIIPISAGGAVHDEDNMQSACTPCHEWKSKHIDPTHRARAMRP